MKVKELIELLKHSDPDAYVAIEYFEVDGDGLGCYSGTTHVGFDADDCKLKDTLFIINIEDYQ